MTGADQLKGAYNAAKWVCAAGLRLTCRSGKIVSAVATEIIATDFFGRVVAKPVLVGEATNSGGGCTFSHSVSY